MKIKSILLALASASLFGILSAAEPEIKGYCPVCYFAADKAVKGTKEFTHVHEGKTYLLVKKEVQEMFAKNPEKYLPQYGGYCAYGVAAGKKFASDPEHYAVYKGKLYLNGNKKVNDKFKADPEAFIKKADHEWKKLNR